MPIANKYSIAELMEACDYYLPERDAGFPLNTALWAVSTIQKRMRRG